MSLICSAFFGVGLADLLTAVVTHPETEVIVRSSFRTRRIALSEVAQVARESGAPIALKLT